MTDRAFDRIMASLNDAVAGRVARETRFIVTDLKTARRMERDGHTYTWQFFQGRPTGKCVVRIVEPASSAGYSDDEYFS